jgi:hypothetical protein
MFALNPQVILAGRITCVFSTLEHGYHNDFNLDGRSGLGVEGSHT